MPKVQGGERRRCAGWHSLCAAVVGGACGLRISSTVGPMVGRMCSRMVSLSCGLMFCLMFSLVFSLTPARPLAAQTLPQTPVAQAQQAPPGVIPSPAELAPKPSAVRSDAAQLPSAPTPPPELPPPDDELTLEVRRYVLDGAAPAALQAALPALTARYLGANRHYEDLINAAAEVTRYLQRELGWYLGYAYIPAQAPRDGVVRIAFLEGRLDEVTLAEPEDGVALPVQRAVIEGYLRRLRSGEILTVREVERVVFLLNDLRGMTASFELQPGRTPGTASLRVRPRAEPRVNGRADLDANGSRFLGLYRLAGLVGWNSPLGRGDALTVNALHSDTGGLDFGLLGYSLPLGGDGWKLGGSLSAVRYQIDQDEVPLNLHGRAATLNAYALYPVVRARNLNLFALLSFDHKQFQDESAGLSTRRQTRGAALGLTGDFRDTLGGGGVSTFDLSWVSGRLDYRDGKPAGNTDADRYAKLGGSYTRLQDVWTHRLLAYLALRGQWARDNLDNSEQFRLGGADGLRAFAPGEGTGDSGALLTLELRGLLPERWVGRIGRESVLSLFYDVGKVLRRRHAEDEGSDFDNQLSYSGAGLGWAWVRPGSHALRVSLAWPLAGTAISDSLQRRPRVYAQLTAFFE